MHPRSRYACYDPIYYDRGTMDVRSIALVDAIKTILKERKMGWTQTRHFLRRMRKEPRMPFGETQIAELLDEVFHLQGDARDRIETLCWLTCMPERLAMQAWQGLMGEPYPVRDPNARRRPELQTASRQRVMKKGSNGRYEV